MAEGIVLLAPAEIPNPDPSFQRDGQVVTAGMVTGRGLSKGRLFVDLRATRRLGQRKAATARQRKRNRGLRSCQATLAVLRGESPSTPNE
jgi:hypothetical protein